MQLVEGIYNSKFLKIVTQHVSTLKMVTSVSLINSTCCRHWQHALLGHNERKNPLVGFQNGLKTGER